MNYYVIGERGFVLAFHLLGIEGAIVENQNEAQTAFREITERSSNVPHVLLISEAISHFLKDEQIAWQQKSRYPLIVETPAVTGQVEKKQTLIQQIGEAIGIHL